MADSATIVGIIGNIISILMFMAPVKTFRKIFKSKSTQDFKATPYVCTLLSVMLWTFYGFLKPGLLIVTINVAGFALEASFLTVFFFYADKGRRIRELRSLLAVFFFFGLIVLVTLAATNQKHTRVMIAGIISVVFSIVMYASPLRVMKLVVQTRSVTYMPFTLSTILFLNGCAWLLYAILVKDIYVGIPNGVGLSLGALQLILYGVFWNISKKEEVQKKGVVETKGPTNKASTPPDISVEKERSKRTVPEDNEFVSIDMSSSSIKTAHEDANLANGSLAKQNQQNDPRK